MKRATALGLLVLGVSAADARSASEVAVSLTDEPLVMRINKDEFRIAFGIKGERCAPAGCRGTIHYRVDWQTAEGSAHTSDLKQVDYLISPNAVRTISVDRQYFDTGEGQHTTNIVKVSIDKITCTT